MNCSNKELYEYLLKSPGLIWHILNLSTSMIIHLEDTKTLSTYINSLDNENQKILLKKYSSGREGYNFVINKYDHNNVLLEHLKEPGYELQKVAVKLHGDFIRYIADPSEEIQILSLALTGNNIQHIPDPSLAVQLKAVSTSGTSIKYINDPCLEIQLAAVKKSNQSIFYIKHIATEIVGLILERCIAKNDMRDAIKLVTSGRINYDDLDDSKKLLVELTGI